MVASKHGGTNTDQDKIVSPLYHCTGIYAEDGTVSRLAKLSSLETAVSEHGCVADTDLGDFLNDPHCTEDFGQYEQPSFTSHHSAGYIPSKHLSESGSVMSSPLDSTLLSSCQDLKLATTQFMVDSTNSTAPSVAFNENLALTEQLDEGEDPLGDGNCDIELSPVDTEPVSHDDCRFYEGEEFVFAATYTEVRGCEADTMQEIQSGFQNDYKEMAEATSLQSAPSLCVDYSRDPDDDDDAGGPRAGPVQLPDGLLHTALGLPELEDDLGNTDTPDKFNYDGSALPDEMQELDASYAT